MRRSAGPESDAADPVGFEEVFAALPLLAPAARSWAELAAAGLRELLADQAVGVTRRAILSSWIW